MSKGGSTETTTAEPWSGVQPHLLKSYQEASNIYDQFTPEWYSGQTQADFSPDQLSAQAGVRDWALQGAPEVMNPALQAYQYGAGTSVLDVANNPYVSGMAQAAAADAMSSLQPELAGIRSGSVLSGGYGGSRQGIAEGTALAGAADSATRAAANIYGQAYGQGLQHQLGTLGQTGSLIGAGFQPYEQLDVFGAQQTAREQALIEDAKARHQFEQDLPYQRLSQYTGALSGTQGLLGGAGMSTAPSGRSTMSNIGDTVQVLAALKGL